MRSFSLLLLSLVLANTGCAGRNPVKDLQTTTAIYISVDKDLFSEPLSNLDKYYTITGRKEIKHFLSLLRLRKCNYVTQAKAQNCIIFKLAKGSYIKGYFISFQGTIALGTLEGEFLGEFRVSRDGVKLIQTYIEKAKVFFREK